MKWDRVQTGKGIYSNLSDTSQQGCWCTIELCTKATFDWTALGVGRSDREGYADNAAD